ncbi:MAG: hypothetical protein NDI75_02615 [Candidatus Didemnitutus sp.]|nr:hypothetical protein [Candidatus Didemnitutus sp.]
MSRWRKEAFDRLPECRKQLQQEKSPNLFFHELGEVLYQAHLQQDEDLIRRIYQYAQWCLEAPRGKDASDDLLTMVTVSFFEHLPTHREVRKEIGRFLPKSVIEGMREVFLYHGTEEKYQEMLASSQVARTKKKNNFRFEVRQR